MHFKYLGINVTKKCNLDCAFCLCGESVNESISLDVIENIFNGVDFIDELYITGGEPLLEPKLIRFIKDEINKRNIKVLKISLTTNATCFNKEIEDTLLYLFDGVEAKLCVSVDKFHKNSIYKKFNKFDKVYVGKNVLYNIMVKRLADFSFSCGIYFEIRDVGAIAKMGRASNFEDAIEVSRKFYALGNYYWNYHLYEDDIIVDTSGEVLRCDYENKEVKELSIGNVLDSTLEDLIYNKCVSELNQMGVMCVDSCNYKMAINSIYTKKNLK